MLIGSEIGGALVCDNGKFINPEGYAICADSINVKGSVFFRNGFKAEGVVSLSGSDIGGHLVCNNGEFIAPPERWAINAEGMTVKGSATFRNGFRAEGEIYLAAAIINGYFVYEGVKSPEKAKLNLKSVKIGALWDEKESWPKKGNLYLDGLIYDNLGGKAPRDAKSRIKWLRLQGGDEFKPQPYEQLAEVLKRSGHGQEARKVLIAKEDDKLTYSKMSRWEGLWHRMYGIGLDYGYYKWKPLIWGVFIIIFGAFFFWAGEGLLTPTKVETYVSENNNTEGVKVSDDYPTFHALAYSADVFIPLIDLQQTKHWLPNANKGRELYCCKWFTIASGGLLLFWQWVQTILGWVLTTMLIFGLARLVRR